jgi:hypothetical protein
VPRPAHHSAQLADDYFRLTHHDVSGKPRLNRRSTDLGLAAALLAELVWERKIWLRGDHFSVVDGTPPSDPLGHAVLDQLIHSEEQGVRSSLDTLSQQAYDQVAQRLWRRGAVRPTTRGILKSTTVWVPTDINAAHWPMARLATRLRDLAPLDSLDLGLAGLCLATGMGDLLVRYASPASDRHLRDLVEQAPQQLRELLTHTEAAVGEAVQSYRV